MVASRVGGPGPDGVPRPDVAMPGMSGPDLQRELVRRRLNTPIVFMTGRDETTAPQVLAHGATACLFKPFSDTALLDALHLALRMT
jgi:FixJ family two-component response regulator